jgi:hypothetical protein
MSTETTTAKPRLGEHAPEAANYHGLSAQSALEILVDAEGAEAKAAGLRSAIDRAAAARGVTPREVADDMLKVLAGPGRMRVAAVIAMLKVERGSGLVEQLGRALHQIMVCASNPGAWVRGQMEAPATAFDGAPGEVLIAVHQLARKYVELLDKEADEAGGVVAFERATYVRTPEGSEVEIIFDGTAGGVWERLRLEVEDGGGVSRVNVCAEDRERISNKLRAAREMAAKLGVVSGGQTAGEAIDDLLDAMQGSSERPLDDWDDWDDAADELVADLVFEAADHADLRRKFAGMLRAAHDAGKLEVGAANDDAKDRLIDELRTQLATDRVPSVGDGWEREEVDGDGRRVCSWVRGEGLVEFTIEGRTVQDLEAGGLSLDELANVVALEARRVGSPS